MPQVLQIGSKNHNSENWKVYHPNGKHMFTCGEKKALWYLKKIDDNGAKLGIKLVNLKSSLNLNLKVMVIEKVKFSDLLVER